MAVTKSLKDDKTKELVIQLNEEGFTQSAISQLLFGTPSKKSTIGDFLRKETFEGFWDKKEPKEDFYSLQDNAKTPDRGLKILVIPDPQVTPGCPLDHISAAGNYAATHEPDVIVVIGDWADCKSLSQFNSAQEQESLRVKDDIDYAKYAMDLFMDQMRSIRSTYDPRFVFTVGNHDPSVRIKRYLKSHPHMEGMLDPEIFNNYLREKGWEVHEFKEIVKIGGIAFSHYFENPHSAKKSPLGGTMDNMLKNCGMSFVQGHTQAMKYAKHFLNDGTVRIGVVCGAFYMHDEDYMGPQGNKSHWRGIIQLNDVKDGGADLCEISMDYLLRKYSWPSVSKDLG